MTSQPFTRSLSRQFPLTARNTVIDAIWLTRLLAALDVRFLPLEEQRDALDVAISEVRQVGLDRINEILVPAIEQVLELSSLGFLIATSETSASIDDGNILDLVVTEGAERALFTPSPFVALTREANTADYAICRLISYLNDTGALRVEVLSHAGNVGPHTDWVIGALAGSTIAQLAMLDSAGTLKAETIAATQVIKDAAVSEVTALKNIVAADKGIVAADKAIVAGYKDEAAQSALDAATFDPNAYYTKTAMDTSLGDKAPVNNPTFTGAVTLPGDPSLPLEAATKQYIDGLLANVGKRARVRAATTANITISTALNAGDTIDGVTLADGDLVLVKNQSTTAQNGVYVVDASPFRAPEFDDWDGHPGSLIAVFEGSTNGDTLWLCTSNKGGTLGTTAIAFSKMTIAGELLSANNLSDVSNAETARTNLGIGSMAQRAFTISTSAASGGSNGDVWAKVT